MNKRTFECELFYAKQYVERSTIILLLVNMSSEESIYLARQGM